MTDDADRERVEALVAAHRVVLFMKGSRGAPQCGFSAATVEILDALLDEYVTVDVLGDAGLREAVKRHADWPTIPQLYIDGAFVGGSDIVRQMFNTGALHDALGLTAPAPTPPAIRLSDEAARIIRQALEDAPGHQVHLAIDAVFEHRFSLAPAEGHEIVSRAGDLDIHMDAATAPRAAGLAIDVEDTHQGHRLRIDNPNAPPPVRSMTVQDLEGRLRRGESLTLVDVRTPAERATARIEPSTLLDDGAIVRLKALPSDTLMVFYCHHGQRSLMAAEHFRNSGFGVVYNLEGGIDAWSREVAPEVPRY